MARWQLYTGQLCRKYKATENFGKFFLWLWDTGWLLYTGPLYRFECSVFNFVRTSVRQHPIKREQHANEVVNKPSVLTLQFYHQCTCTFSVHKVFLGLITSCCSGNDSTLLPQKDTWRGVFAITYFHQHPSSHFFSGRNQTQPKRVTESEKKTSCFAKKMLSK